jgi:tetratricopeptide (TPR) repeat protein
MPERAAPLILLSLMVLLSAEVPFEQKEMYDVGDVVSNLSAIWAGDLEGDRISEILVGGIRYEAGYSKGVLVLIKRNEVSSIASIPGISRTLIMTICNALEAEGREIVVGSQGIYTYSRSGIQLTEKSTEGDVTALLAVNFDNTGLDEIIYGTSTGDVVYLVGFEAEYQFSVGGEVRFILPRDDDTYYVVTSHTIYCRTSDGEPLWSHTVKGEIRSAAAYDTNNDTRKELIYISGPTISSLSLDGQQETLILSPRELPLSILVEEVTGDGKADLIVANNVNKLVIYSNLKEEVQSFFFRREADETPLLYAADTNDDSKMDLVYGGLTTVVMFENITPPQELITQGEILFSQGVDLEKHGEYEEALGKFEDAEVIFTEVGNEERVAQCQQYIADITDILEKVFNAQSIVDEGQNLFDQGKYREARSKFEAAAAAYTQLALIDDQYAPSVEEAEALIDRCDLGIADEYFQSGETLIQQKEYEDAIEQFEKAEAIYSRLESEKAQTTRDRIEQVRDMKEQIVIEDETSYVIYGGAALVIVVVAAVFLATRKKVSARLEKGHVYLILESQPRKGLQLVKEYGRLGYDGLVISRQSPEQIRKKKLKKQKILQLSSATKEDSIPPDNVVNILLRMKEFMTSRRNSILLLDSLDYVVIQNTFDDAVSLIQKLVESVVLYKGILLVSLNPKSLEEKEVVQLEGEMELLEM